MLDTEIDYRIFINLRLFFTNNYIRIYKFEKDIKGGCFLKFERQARLKMPLRMLGFRLL